MQRHTFQKMVESTVKIRRMTRQMCWCCVSSVLKNSWPPWHENESKIYVSMVFVSFWDIVKRQMYVAGFGDLFTLQQSNKIRIVTRKLSFDICSQTKMVRCWENSTLTLRHKVAMFAVIGLIIARLVWLWWVWFESIQHIQEDLLPLYVRECNLCHMLVRDQPIHKRSPLCKRDMATCLWESTVGIMYCWFL